MLSLESLQQFLLPPLAFFPPQFLGWYWLTAATLRMSVVCRPTRSLLRVFLFPPLCSTILKPHLKQTTTTSLCNRRRIFLLISTSSQICITFVFRTLNQAPSHPPYPTFLSFFFSLLFFSLVSTKMLRFKITGEEAMSVSCRWTKDQRPPRVS